ncbi:hypothetical protein COLO4_16374 [Corchorus olitorius]|uniref:Uncharacterized protein n=1 Tax=Corchorus olitorius TaxID=93759 RepID=A0A1R3JHZ4_9ROSI|nr:hypothetical protein COLO4_16374 [Corchorus olitorius]
MNPNYHISQKPPPATTVSRSRPPFAVADDHPNSLEYSKITPFTPLFDLNPDSSLKSL